MELFVKYKPVDQEHFPVDDFSPDNNYEKFMEKSDMLYEWGTLHKTMIVLNGGFLSDMQEALEFLNTPENPYPVAEFYESQEAMGGMLTNIAIVLPEKIYKSAEFMRKKWIDGNLNTDPKLHITVVDEVEEILAGFGEFSTYELELCAFMNQFRMAS
jgi:hypothetical protein